MLFRRETLDGILRGDVTLAFRRWKRPTVKPGGRVRTAAGVVRIGAIEIIAAGALTEKDARVSEKLKFKPDVRKLKELGLTESLDVGYRLSPRGEVVLKRVGKDQ